MAPISSSFATIFWPAWALLAWGHALEPSNAFVPALPSVKSVVPTTNRCPPLDFLPSLLPAKKKKEDHNENDEGQTTTTSSSSFNKRWDEHIAGLIKYNATFGTVNIPYTHAINGDKYASLAEFIRYCRNRQGRLSRERHAQLTSMGISWDGLEVRKEREDQQWEEMFQRLVAYNQTHGNCKVPNNWVDSKGVRLGRWVSRQRTFKTNGLMRGDRKAKLDSIGFVWMVRAGGAANRPDLERKWEQKRQELIQYHKENGHYLVPRDKKNKKNPLNSLGHWVDSQRKLYKNGNLQPDREELLNDIGFPWDQKKKLDAQWQAKFNQLKEVLERNSHSQHNGTTCMCTVTVLGSHLYNWVLLQRDQKGKGTLDLERKELLDEIGFQWT